MESFRIPKKNFEVYDYNNGCGYAFAVIKLFASSDEEAATKLKDQYDSLQRFFLRCPSDIAQFDEVLRFFTSQNHEVVGQHSQEMPYYEIPKNRFDSIDPYLSRSIQYVMIRVRGRDEEEASAFLRAHYLDKVRFWLRVPSDVGRYSELVRFFNSENPQSVSRLSSLKNDTESFSGFDFKVAPRRAATETTRLEERRVSRKRSLSRGRTRSFGGETPKKSIVIDLAVDSSDSSEGEDNDEFFNDTSDASDTLSLAAISDFNDEIKEKIKEEIKEKPADEDSLVSSASKKMEGETLYDPRVSSASAVLADRQQLTLPREETSQPVDRAAGYSSPLHSSQLEFGEGEVEQAENDAASCPPPPPRRIKSEYEIKTSPQSSQGEYQFYDPRSALGSQPEDCPSSSQADLADLPQALIENELGEEVSFLRRTNNQLSFKYEATSQERALFNPPKRENSEEENPGGNERAESIAAERVHGDGSCEMVPLERDDGSTTSGRAEEDQEATGGPEEEEASRDSGVEGSNSDGREEVVPLMAERTRSSMRRRAEEEQEGIGGEPIVKRRKTTKAKCEKCGDVFSTSKGGRYLREHVKKRHLGHIHIYKCGGCEQTFSTKSAANTHSEMTHPSSLPIEIVEDLARALLATTRKFFPGVDVGHVVIE